MLEVIPPLHRDLAAVELSISVVPAFTGTLLLACGLSSVTPAEVVEVPECVCRQDEVPDRERHEVDTHPQDVGDAMSGDDDQQTGKTEDEGEQNERDRRCHGVGHGCVDGLDNCKMC